MTELEIRKIIHDALKDWNSLTEEQRLAALEIVLPLKPQGVTISSLLEANKYSSIPVSPLDITT